MRIIATAAAAILAAGWALGASAADTGDKQGLATSHQQKPAAEPQQNVPGPTPQETSTRTDSDKFVGGKDQGRAQEQSGSSGSHEAGSATAKSGEKVPGGAATAREHEMSGSSGGQEKDAKKDGAAK